MSTATRFKYYRPFPFCPFPFSGTPGGSSFDNVSLADAMALAWNCENVQIDCTGTLVKGPFPGSPTVKTLVGDTTLYLNPLNASAPFDRGGSAPQMALPVYNDGSGHTAPLPGPNVKQPKERVCYERFVADDFIAQMNGGVSTDPSIGENSFSFQIGINADAVNAGKYVISFGLDVFRIYDPFVYDLALRFSTADTGGWLSSGTFSLFGYTIPWYFYTFGSYDTATGINVSATSSSFTY